MSNLIETLNRLTGSIRLNEKGLRSVVMMTLGYRDSEMIFCQRRKKSDGHMKRSLLGYNDWFVY